MMTDIRMRRDPYNHQEKYLRWLENNKSGIKGISRQNSDIILKYLYDMERGINISSSNVKGSRSYARLNSLKLRAVDFAKKFEKLYDLKEITQIKEEQLIGFFSDISNGRIKREDGKQYISTETYVKIFKAFWHWWMKVQRKQGVNISDITIDLDLGSKKPKWVYMTEEQVKRLCDNAKYEYSVLMMFLFDTGIRAPTELVNVKISDLYNDCKEFK